jgi:putative Holliday junction resolvase
MPEGVFLGFDFGMKRIGVAVGQQITASARPLRTLHATQGVPDWHLIGQLIKEWQPQALLVGIPRKIDGKRQYTTKLANKFADSLHERFSLPVHRVDERLTTVEARQQLFDEGGYRKLKSSEIDSYAAKLIVEQWLASC